MGKEKRLRRRKTSKFQKIIYSLYISVFVLVSLSIVYYLTPISYVSEVNVEGNEYVSGEDIVKLSGITNKTRFWPSDLNFSEKKIKANKQIDKVEIKRVLPNSINIKVNEYARVAYILEEHKLYPVTSSGSIIREEANFDIDDLPLLINFKEGKELQRIAKELHNTNKEALSMISEIHHTPTDINPLHISVYMTNGYEVIGSISDFAMKISGYPSVAVKIPEGVKGVIDMEVGFVLKVTEGAEGMEKKSVE